MQGAESSMLCLNKSLEYGPISCQSPSNVKEFYQNSDGCYSPAASPCTVDQGQLFGCRSRADYGGSCEWSPAWADVAKHSSPTHQLPPIKLSQQSQSLTQTNNIQCLIAGEYSSKTSMQLNIHATSQTKRLRKFVISIPH